MSELAENKQTDLDAVLERISPAHREAFLKSRLRLKQFHENDEVLAITTHLDNFAAVIGDLTGNVIRSEILLKAGNNNQTNGTQPGTLPMVKASQIDSIVAAFKSLHKDLATKQDLEILLATARNGHENKALTAFLDDYGVDKALKRLRINKAKAFAEKWTFILAVCCLLGLGILNCLLTWRLSEYIYALSQHWHA